MAARNDVNRTPDNIAKARAIVQVARAAAASTHELEDGVLERALWAAEDLLAEIEQGARE